MDPENLGILETCYSAGFQASILAIFFWKTWSCPLVAIATKYTHSINTHFLCLLQGVCVYLVLVDCLFNVRQIYFLFFNFMCLLIVEKFTLKIV
jgi:hypothetical protein